MLVLCIIESFKLGILLSFCEKIEVIKVYCSSISTIQAWSKSEVVRVNGQITEVKQSRPRIILRWVTISDPYILSFFSLAMISKYIRQIRQISQIFSAQFEFGKTSNVLKESPNPTLKGVSRCAPKEPKTRARTFQILRLVQKDRSKREGEDRGCR